MYITETALILVINGQNLDFFITQLIGNQMLRCWLWEPTSKREQRTPDFVLNLASPVPPLPILR